jgi:hypothetical protein
MCKFVPDERQKRLIDAAIAAHRAAQATGEFAPEHLVQKWSSESDVVRPDSTKKRGGSSPSDARQTLVQWSCKLLSRIFRR